jgi:hypothetical protein
MDKINDDASRDYDSQLWTDAMAECHATGSNGDIAELNFWLVNLSLGRLSLDNNTDLTTALTRVSSKLDQAVTLNS